MENYIYRFEEVLEDRVNTLKSVEKVCDENLALIELLEKNNTNRPEDKKEFVMLIANLKDQSKKYEEQKEKLKKSIEHLTKLIEDLKQTSDENMVLINDLIDELGVFA